MPDFKVGDRVRVIDGGRQLRNGAVHVVHRANYPGLAGADFVDIDMGGNAFYARRFVLAEPVLRPFQVGDKVKVVKRVPEWRGWVGNLDAFIGQEGEVVVKRVHDGAADFVRLNFGWNFPPEALELVEAAPIPEAVRAFQVGDKVKIVRAVPDYKWHWVDGEMGNRVGDGEEYTIASVDVDGDDQIVLEHLPYIWPHAAFELVALDAPVPPQPPMPKPAPMKKEEKSKLSLRADLWKQVEEKQKRRAEIGICSFAVECEDGKRFFTTYGPCHAALAHMVPAKKKAAALAYNIRHERNFIIGEECKTTLDLHKRYVKYILNESPWKDCFLTKRLDTALRYDILMDVTKNRHQIAAACIALREGSEFQAKLTVFDTLSRKGYSGHTAYLLSSAFSFKDKNTLTMNGMGGGHMVLSGQMDSTEVLEFFKNGYSLGLNEPSYADNHTAYEVFRFISPVYNRKLPKQDLSAWMDENVEKKQIGAGWEKKTIISLDALYKLADKLDKFFKGE
jgi:hypothetical protein